MHNSDTGAITNIRQQSTAALRGTLSLVHGTQTCNVVRHQVALLTKREHLPGWKSDIVYNFFQSENEYFHMSNICYVFISVTSCSVILIPSIVWEQSFYQPLHLFHDKLRYMIFTVISEKHKCITTSHKDNQTNVRLSTQQPYPNEECEPVLVVGRTASTARVLEVEIESVEATFTQELNGVFNERPPVDSRW